MPKPVETIEQRAKRRAREAAEQREALGSIAVDVYGGRTAEVPGAEGGRTDYTPEQAPTEHPPTILIGEPANHPATQIGPTEQMLTPEGGKLKKKAKDRLRNVIGE